MGSLDKTVLIPDLLKVRGLLRLQVDSYNHFLAEEIKKIIARNSVIESSYDPEIYIRFTGVSIGVPSIVEDFCTRALTPHICRLTDTTYSAPIKVNVTYTQRINNVLTTLHKKDITIGSLPIMLRSNRCVLNGKDEIQHARLGECPLDPGGYFIIKGSERVVIIQEDTVKNKIMLEMDTKGRLVASVTSCTPTVQSKAVLSFNRDVLELELDAFSEPVPIVFVLKAMGILCAKELVEMTGKDPKYAPLIDWSVEMSLTDNIRTQEQALAYLDGKVNINWLADRSANMRGRALHILHNVFLANIPVHEDNLGPKCTYVAVMIEFLLEATLMKYILDDQNHEGNKRYQLSGDLLSLLFEDLFKKMNTEVMKQIDMAVKNKSRTQYYNYIMRSGLTQGLERALYTGNWDLKLFKMHKTGITQVLSRLSFIASLGHMTRISSQVDMSKKVSGPRQLHSSQWGMICPCDTPVGEGCGLVKNLALVARFSTKEQDASIISLCHTLGVKEMEWAREAVRMDNSFLVFYNGLILGKHERPQDFANGLRELRRSKSIGECVSVFVDDEHRCVNIASDGGRPCRPLVIADKGVSRITERHLKQMRDGELTFSDFLDQGLIEYLDVNEQNNALIALHEEAANIETTHIEIAPFTVLGICAGLIPFPHHNQAPRNTYQCAMGKQAIGNVAYNQLFRMDSPLYLLVYPQRPLLTTNTIELVGYDKLGGGQNATVAVMSSTGYDIGHAVVLKKSSLDRGFGRCTVLERCVVKHKNGTQDTILGPEVGAKNEKTQILDNDGIAAPGEKVRVGDIYVRREVPTNTMDNIQPENIKYRSAYHMYRRRESAIIDKVVLYPDDNNKMCIKLQTRQTRRPEVGDRFSSRHGRKGVCGIILQEKDMPFSESGISPDLVMNPHGFLSQMTLGEIIELLGCKSNDCGRVDRTSGW